MKLNRKVESKYYTIEEACDVINKHVLLPNPMFRHRLLDFVNRGKLKAIDSNSKILEAELFVFIEHYKTVKRKARKCKHNSKEKDLERINSLDLIEKYNILMTKANNKAHADFMKNLEQYQQKFQDVFNWEE